MKKYISFIVFALSLSHALADMPLPPEVQKAKDKQWKEAKCKDPKNMIVCNYSTYSKEANECSKYQDKPKEFKPMGHQGGNYSGQSKYCHLVGADQ